MACHVLNEAAVDEISKSNQSGINGDLPATAPEQRKRTERNEYKLKSSHVRLRRHRDRNLYCSKRKGTERFAKLDRFNRTVLALQYSGLFEISTGICQLVRDSDSLQKEINKLQEEIAEFNKSNKGLVQQQFKEQSEVMSKE